VREREPGGRCWFKLRCADFWTGRFVERTGLRAVGLASFRRIGLFVLGRLPAPLRIGLSPLEAEFSARASDAIISCASFRRGDRRTYLAADRVQDKGL